MKIKEWFIKIGKIDWKWYAIFLLLLNKFKLFIAMSMLTLSGIAFYPTSVEPNIFVNAGNRIGESYAVMMDAVFNQGLNLGEVLYPYNVIFTKVCFWLIVIVLFGIVIIFVLSIVINLINIRSTNVKVKIKKGLIKNES